MNIHLQRIFDLIKQSAILSTEDKVVVEKAIKDTAKEMEILSFKLDRTEKVKHTTAVLLEETIEELEQKRKAVEAQNRELEVESSLERVRTVALSMNKRDDMLLVCRMISNQLELLNVKEIRNIQTAIFYEEKGIYSNFEYYALHDKLLVTEVEYKNHPMSAEFANEMLSGPGKVFIISMEGKEMKDWYAFQKTTNQFADTHLEVAASLNYYWFSLGPVALGISTYASLKEEDIELFKRFRNVFELAYRRFLDIEKAEAQAREARIELALERVRARTMAMQRSDELSETAQILFQQLKDLGETPIQITIGIFDEEAGIIDFNVTNWGGAGNQIAQTFNASIEEPTLMQKIYKAWKANQKSVVIDLTGQELLDWVAYRNSMSGTTDHQFKLHDRRAVHVGLFSKGLLSFSTHLPRPAESLNVLERFAGVFDQTYTRFLDLQKAEAQAREAQIELGLERIRARAMAMHQTNELLDTGELLYKELTILGINSLSVTYSIMSDDEDFALYYGINPIDGKVGAKPFVFPHTETPVMRDILVAWKKQEAIHSIELNEAATLHHQTYIGEHILAGIKKNKLDMPFSVEAFLAVSPKKAFINTFNFKQGYLFIIGDTRLTNEQQQILLRFTKVFELTYRRFLDLRQAEAQAREAQIEAALERVRSRTMGMQKSAELKEVIQVVYDQYVHLNIHVEHTGFVMDYKARDDYDIWIADQLGVPSHVIIPYFDCVYYNRFNEAKKKGEEFFVTNLDFEEKNKFYHTLIEYVPGLPEETKDFLFSIPGLAASTVLLENIGHYIENFEGIPYTDEENSVLMRFGKVFQQTYTRFLDLQKAEAQTRESQIEASLERVRSKAMAMHTSDDLSETVKVYFQELKNLGMILLRCGVAEYGDEPYLANITVTSATAEGDSFQILGRVRQIGHPVLEGIYEHWVRQEEFFPVLKGKDLHAYNQVISSKIDLPDLPEDAIQYGYYFYFKEGSFFVWAQEKLSDDAIKLFRRFTSVLSLTYRRYLDLVEAETQAKEAKIEAGLERVRSRTMAMHSSDELAETAAVVFRQLIGLGIAPTRLYIGIVKDNHSNEIEMWATDEDGSKVNTQFTGNIDRSPVIHKMFDGWRENLKSLTIDMQGKELSDYFKYLSEELQVPFRLGLDQKRRVQSIAYFSKGFIGIASPEPQPEETKILLERFASVFNLTFTRFNDLKIAEQHAEQAKEDLVKLQVEKKRAEEALTELRATQAQLIQSEKMASLGELTAGIAHEIQNPLNFVNNFSEVNTELVEELKQEIIKGNLDEVKAIANDIKDNQEKITHHGKRADAIVKGMLQHSRTSSGVKEPTDINVLADEYLRLAYHGLRAKDKSFNAAMKTDFDPNIGLISIIPQDIGRVILNLITNAFYAVTEKKKQQRTLPPEKGGNYEPTVTVSTKKLLPPVAELSYKAEGKQVEALGGAGVKEAMVEISVKDNGNGIPQKVLDKIFQPFFTTKPTGQGTGLGLSLSYDIVKAHGGELKVETTEGEGTTFIVLLPDEKPKAS